MHQPFLRGLMVAALALTGTISTAAPPAPPAGVFFGNPAMSAALLSPDGRALAIKSATGGSREALAVIDLASNKISRVAAFNDVDVGNFQWVNSERLVFDTTDKRRGARDRSDGPGLYAVNRDGGDLRLLASRRSGRGAVAITGGVRQKIQPWNTFLLSQQGAQDSDSVYVIRPDIAAQGRVNHTNLLQLNTLTGQVKTVPRPDNTEAWLLDQHGQPRLAVARDKNTASVHYLDPAHGAWRQLASFSAHTDSAQAFSPLAFGPDGTLYVKATAGKDKIAVHAFDLSSGKIRPDPLVVIADYDFNGSLVMDKDRLLGMRVLTDAESTIWFEPGMKALQQQVDERLPATVNIISLPKRAGTPWVLVESYSDVQPRLFQVYDTQARTFRKVGDSRPGIVPGTMGQQEMVRYQARDSMTIPALLTLAPERRGAGPMVVLVHGGPFLRGSAWGWAPVRQFLASRGYTVLEPEFRGSTGFGETHFRSGWKQWGRGMQDDIADGVRWAVAQGIADSKRVCIAGAGYGGYSVLMGLARDPGLYQCGVSWAGVTDINLIFRRQGIFDYDLSARYRKYGIEELVGDPASDAGRLKQISPLELAAQVQVPVLLAFGGADAYVPAHSMTRFHEKVSKTNRDVELLEYPAEGHVLASPENRIDYWTRVEKFLDRNIGKP